jgi:hypothetical protein
MKGLVNARKDLVNVRKGLVNVRKGLVNVMKLHHFDTHRNPRFSMEAQKFPRESYNPKTSQQHVQS